MQADLVRPEALSAADRAAWMALRGAAFANPLLGPDFAEAVGRVRTDVAVAVFRNNGRAIGFLPHHRRPQGLGRPIGAPFSDYHGLVAEPGVAAEEALRAAGLREYRFNALVDPHGAFAKAATAELEARLIVIGPGDTAGTDYLEALRAGSPKRFKNVRRLGHKLDREVGAVRLIAADPDPAHFETMFRWKREQLVRSGLHDVFHPAWVSALMQGLFERREADFRGLMITLMAGNRPATIHFGVREGDVFHPWIAAQDPDLAAYSPGQTFLWSAIEAMPSMGLRTYDLGAGHDHYKAPFTSTTTALREGELVLQPNLCGHAWTLAESTLGSGGVARLRRRMEQISSVELTLGGRARGLAHAIAGQGRRAASRPGGPVEVQG